MRKIKFKLFIVFLLAAAATAAYLYGRRNNKADGELVKEISPVRGSIGRIISSTGTVLPKNRLEVKPPVNGRLESVLVKEGEEVKAGKVLAWMSSTERAALLDAARGKGQQALEYWKDTYKPIPLPAPIDGQVIVATAQPGQAVTTSDAVIVLSDHLIIRAQVDETDIGNISVGMKAAVTLDAYSDQLISALVEHIYYESETINNVTIYKVDLRPDDAPDFLRSGMNASVDFMEDGRNNAIIIPQEAVYKDGDKDYVLLKNEGQGPVKTEVSLGISDGKNVEVVSGVGENDRVILKTKKYSLPTSDKGTNPFMPNRRR